MANFAEAMPMVWLGQSVDTSTICSDHQQLRRLPFLTSLGCAIRRPTLRESHFTERLKTKLGIAGPLMVDSGGFVLSMRPDLQWKLQSVANCISRIDADIFVSLDYPPSPGDTKEARLAKIRKSHRNYALLAQKFPHKLIMPVIHGRAVSEIEKSIDLLLKKERPARWVGLGGVVPLLQHRCVSREVSSIGPELFIARALALIRKAFPKAKIHVFGAGGTRTFPAIYALGGDSADSIAWRYAAGFGSIFLPLKSQRAVRWNTTKRPPRKLLDAEDLLQLELCECPMCSKCDSLEARLVGLRSNFYNRSIHNAWVVSQQMTILPKSRMRVASLVEDGCLGTAWAKAVSDVSAC
jgi:queuine/archaeosine tRNA-ribosyltransferase